MSRAHFELVLRGGTVITPFGALGTDVGVSAGRIAGLGAYSASSAEEVIDARGLFILPGVIDSQVHFREPGMQHKENLETGSRAAALGGVTTFFEMPNTEPPTNDARTINDKLDRGRGRSHVDYAFFVGGTPKNAEDLSRLEQTAGISGVKVFMGSSTGSLLAEDDEALESILSSCRRRVAIHAEDESRLRERRRLAELEGDVAFHPSYRDELTALRATERCLRLARRHRAQVHILHVSTMQELDLLRTNKDIATCEVTPQHLLLHAPDCYRRLGSKAQMNPPIRDRVHQLVLWEAVRNGLFDTIGSDHAPHTLEEKAKPYPECPSGMPGVQTTLPLMLTAVLERRLSMARAVDLLCAGPARVFGLANKGSIRVGYDADFAIVDLRSAWTLTDSQMAYLSGWTPFHGWEVRARVVRTIVRGKTVAADGELVGQALGRPAQFLGVRS